MLDPDEATRALNVHGMMSMTQIKELSVHYITSTPVLTCIAAMLTSNTRAVKSLAVNSGPSASSINHDRRSFCHVNEHVLNRTKVTNRLIIPSSSILIQVFLSLFDYRAKKFHTTYDALMDVCKASNQSVIVENHTKDNKGAATYRLTNLGNSPITMPPLMASMVHRILRSIQSGSRPCTIAVIRDREKK